MAQTILDRKIGTIPPSGLGPDGKLRVMTEEEHRQYIESALRRIDEIEQIPTTQTILPKKSGCGRSTNSVLIGPCSKDATEVRFALLREVTEQKQGRPPRDFLASCLGF